MLIQGSESFYVNRINTLTTVYKGYRKKDNILTIIRVVSVVSIIPIILYTENFYNPIFYGLLTSCLVAFIWTVIKRNGMQLNMQFLKNKIDLNNRELLIARKEYGEVYNGSDLIEKQHPYETDLDIFANGSVFQVLNRTSTLSGLNILTSWLKNPFLNKNEIIANQESIKELAGKFEWCQDFCSRISNNKDQLNDKSSFFTWIALSNRLVKIPLYRYLIYILPVLSIALLIPTLLGYLNPYWFGCITAIQLIISLFNAKHTNYIHKNLGPRLYYVDGILSIIKLLIHEDFISTKNSKLKAALMDKSASAITEIKILKRISDSFDNRMNVILAVILNGIFLYDLRLVLKLEQWKIRNQVTFNKWHEVIGEFDALISLAIFSYNHPNYTFSEIREDQFFIKAKNLKHPLMDEDIAIPNDYEISGIPRIDILTGANMAGKSTFLRTLGVSLVLSMIGAPVNASHFVFSPISLYTSLRTNDSLQNNESFFYAELKKLKGLMENYLKTPNVFFLLDEILKGTNSTDQYNGAKKLIEKLININGFGVIATHDLALSKLEDIYPKMIRNIRFEINIVDRKMNFRYKLEEGVAKTMNGTFLLEELKIV